MGLLKEETSNFEPEKLKGRSSKASIYRVVWRWHFYAGLIFAPFLIILAISGGVYLFKPQIESNLYHEYYYIQEESSEALTASVQIAKVKETHPAGSITSLTFYDDPTRTTEVGLLENGQMSSIFVNPYNGEIAGSLRNEEKFTEIFKKLHSELIIGGTFANRLVELAACWAIILLTTGLYIWWPRNRASIWGTVLPLLNKKGRTFWRDMHAVPAFWLSLLMLIWIATGLPWSGIMGAQIDRLANSTHTGKPQFADSWGEKPESVIKTKDVAEDVPWATENLLVPASTNNGYTPLSLDGANGIAEHELIKKPYTISVPEGDKGVYTISTSHTKPWDNATLHIDQYSGAIISDVRFTDFGVLAKAVTVGIALHEGRLFGLANQLIGLAVCIGLIGVIASSFVMWRKRKPEGSLGSPQKSKDKKITRTVFIIMLFMGVIMPLVGISIIVVMLLDRFVFVKIKPLKEWIG